MKIKRKIFKQLTHGLKEPEVLILLGARQVGKTFLLNELEEYCKRKKKKTKYFNLELPEHSRYFAKDIVELYKEVTNNIDFLFIDEFQYFNNASKFFKAIFDDRRIKTKVIASGSSSLEMHKHLKESLAGRKTTEIIRTLSFKEFKQTKQGFDLYLQYGANPGLVHVRLSVKKIKLLKEILETYIMKDVKSLIREENISAFNNLLYHLASSQGQVVSTSSLANELKVTNLTVESYLSILEQTYVLYKLNSYSGNLSNELKKSKKYYLYDLGIRNAILHNFANIKTRNDKGAIYESCVYHFLTNNCPPNGELRFWRTRDGKEIDFIYLRDGKPYLFEVKSKLSRMEIPDSIKSFIRNYANLQGVYIINENLEGEVSYKGLTVKFVQLENLEFDLELQEIFSTAS